MKKGYETVLVVDALLPEEQIESVVKGVQDYIAKKCDVKLVERLGRRKMAYKIQRKSHGFYALYAYDAESDFISDLDRKLRLDENVLRHLTVVREIEPVLEQ